MMRNQTLPTLESLTVRVPLSHDIKESRAAIIDLFNRYGALVVEFEADESPREQLLCFMEIFGKGMPHDRADSDMIAEIAVSEDFQGYLGTSNAEHPFHTDGAYFEVPPRVIALRCDIAATHGGVSRLASGENIYHYLLETDPEATHALFNPDALCVSRAGQGACQALFQRHEDRIYIRYRSDDTSVPSSDAIVRRGMKHIQDYLTEEQNYLSFTMTHGQVLITDNTRTLHARTAFTKNEPRRMHRLFLEGGTDADPALVFGFSA